MSQKSADIRMEYVKLFRHYFNQYMMLRKIRPFDELVGHRRTLFQLGLLVDVWATIERHLSREKRHG